ncbi:uncharacterized protein LOC117482511 isoform X5 [Trematomus bernacchii]|uniref:uncharacterized protein LOC117482511 isoform X5 n=1 Tax=Trematomus bernacchii TaxID=40690 RepID=UPI00146CFCB2|nr:uncharacterized protein LOC117482511 isoform X5 [Trematomus bernacchii]
MDEFKQIKMSVFLILLLQFTGAATGQFFLSRSVRVGDEAILSCNYVKPFKLQCYGTTWTFADSASTVELVKGGQIRSDRLRVTENCSLVIKKVTEEDAGTYTCRQIRSEKDGPNCQVYLSVVTSEDTTAAATESDTRSGFTTTASVITEDATGWWWWIIVGIVGVAALIIIITLYTSHRFKVSPSFLQDLFSCLFSTETSDE